ncbi:MAG: hypothetical protein U9Q27_00345 [Patescibacteria group bacterium]|nr:hypothetical protein [Patescibacteria group bacterium]
MLRIEGMGNGSYHIADVSDGGVVFVTTLDGRVEFARDEAISMVGRYERRMREKQREKERIQEELCDTKSL